MPHVSWMVMARSGIQYQSRLARAMMMDESGENTLNRGTLRLKQRLAGSRGSRACVDVQSFKLGDCRSWGSKAYSAEHGYQCHECECEMHGENLDGLNAGCDVCYDLE